MRSVRSKTNWSAMSLIAGGSSTAAAPGAGAGARLSRPKSEQEVRGMESRTHGDTIVTCSYGVNLPTVAEGGTWLESL